jgi:cation transport ATPase
MDTSLLTGESVAGPAADGDRLLAGTSVVQGEAEAVVEATGARTGLAAIAQLTQSGEESRRLSAPRPRTGSCSRSG